MPTVIYNSTKSISNQEQSHRTKIKKTAASLTRHGIPVFPCLPNKRPTHGSNGFKDASLDVEQFEWKQNYLIGVPTVLIFDVLDIDHQHDEAKDWLKQHITQIPDTRMHQTRSGGFHIFFQADARVGNTTSKISGHIDTRGKGGYVIWWPALGLEVVNSAIIAPWPEWLLEKILKQPTLPPPPISNNNRPASSYDIHAALDSIDAGCDYQTWFEILVGLKSELGEGGYALARAWSSTSDKYPGDRVFARKWQSIIPRRITVGTVFHYAKLTNLNWKYDFTNKIFSSTRKEGI